MVTCKCGGKTIKAKPKRVAPKRVAPKKVKAEKVPKKGGGKSALSRRMSAAATKAAKANAKGCKCGK